MTDLHERTVPQSTVDQQEKKRMDSIWWAGVLIWIGLILGAEFLNVLPELGGRGEFWRWIFLGVGPWSLLLNLYFLQSGWPSPSTWDWVWTVVFMGVAIGTFVDIGFEIVGAIALVVIGSVILYRAIVERA